MLCSIARFDFRSPLPKAMRHRIALHARIALLTIVGTIATLPPSDLAAQAPSAAAAKKPVPTLADRLADEALVEARRAFVRGDATRFEAAAARASGHMLAEYLEFWRLRMQLQREDAGFDAEASDRRIARFLATYRGTIVADLLRRDWLVDLGKRGRWDLFDAQYAQWVLQDDDEVHCYHWLSQVGRGLPASGALTQLNSVRDLGDACGDLLAAAHARGLIDRNGLYLRLLLGLETNSRDAVERSAALLGFDLGALETAWSRPERTLSAGDTREMVLIALSRLARSDPQAAALQLRADPGPLTEAEQVFAWSQVAAAGMRSLLPEAMEWTRLSLRAPITDETRAWLARAALREQDWPSLRLIIEQMDGQTREDPTWTYWHGRTLVAAGDTAGGRALYRKIAGEYHFYGTLAAEELGQLFRSPPLANEPSEAELVEAARQPGFARALKFYDLGLRLEGNREWNYQLRGMNDRQLLAAAHWACGLRVLDRCVNTADRTRKEHDFRLRFVAPFYDELEPVAVGRGLDPAWIYGLIRQESRFIMDARSSAGAQGLMQIMPATGRWIAGKLGVRNFKVSQLNELPTNLEFGTFYLKNVLDQLDQSPVLASAAYNAGPGRPRTWRTTLSSPVEGAIFAEIIPFTETRDYVKKVLSNAVIYAELFSGRPQSLKIKLGHVQPAPATLASSEP
jgi:soluble lytic murein transglycosylase